MSCSKSKVQESVAIDESSTLKYEIDILEKNIDWAEEIDSSRLTENISVMDEIGKSVNLNVENVIASRYFDNPKLIFPSISGFGSLDTRDLDYNIKKMIEDFCESVQKSNDAYKYMQKNHDYSLTLFLYDIAENYAAVFDGKSLSYILGKPIITSDLFLIPVRFYNSQNLFLDIEIYLVQDSDSWKINQIRIKNGGK